VHRQLRPFTTHWMENKDSVPAVMLVTGIAKKE
jgi:hypothetical protein